MRHFDRLILLVIAGLIVLIGGVVALGDRAGASIRVTMPADESSPPITTDIRITFGQPMVPDSVIERFSISPEVDGEFSWDGNTLKFEPLDVLEAGRTYTVILETGAQSDQGRLTRNMIEWSFTPREPSILYIAPVDAEVRALWRISPKGGEPTQIFAPEHGIFNYSVTRDGTRIAVAVFNEDMSSDIWLINNDGSNGQAITDCAPASCSGPAWSPDGTVLAYERQDATATGSSGPSRIWLYDAATSTTAPVYEDNQVLGFGAQWSPDGSRLAFFDANRRAIRVVSVTDGEAAMISSDMGEVGSFSADSSAMAFANIRKVGGQFFTELWIAHLEVGGGLQPLVESPEEDQSPAWSPDGEWIAFSRRRLDRQGGFGSQLMLFNTQTSELVQATSDPRYNNTRFVWSLTSDQVIVQRFDLEQMQSQLELWIYDLESGTMHELVSNGISAAWLP